jgi:hypothetical protein
MGVGGQLHYLKSIVDIYSKLEVGGERYTLKLGLVFAGNGSIKNVREESGAYFYAVSDNCT